MFLHYLHLDLTLTGIVLVILLAGGLSGKFVALRSMGSVIPDFSISAGVLIVTGMFLGHPTHCCGEGSMV